MLNVTTKKRVLPLFICLVVLLSGCYTPPSQRVLPKDPLPLQAVGVPLTPKLESFLQNSWCLARMWENRAVISNSRWYYPYGFTLTKLQDTIWQKEGEILKFDSSEGSDGELKGTGEMYRTRIQVTHDVASGDGISRDCCYDFIVITYVTKEKIDVTGKPIEEWRREWYRIEGPASLFLVREDFSNFSAKEQSMINDNTTYFPDGMTDDLITDLWRTSGWNNPPGHEIPNYSNYAVCP
jgi:hypothetical protein